jgi:hypothetical protein
LSTGELRAEEQDDRILRRANVTYAGHAGTKAKTRWRWSGLRRA